MRIAQLLSDSGARVHMLGGTVRNTSNAVVGPWAVKALAEIKAGIAFLGTSGFLQRGGPCIENYDESEVKKAMIASAGRAVLLADAGKASGSAMIQFAAWSDFDLFITDKTMAPHTLRALRNELEVALA
jgi:DeoR family fructose operon transcriptional repressor